LSLEGLAMDKHSGLFRFAVSEEGKSFKTFSVTVKAWPIEHSNLFRPTLSDKEKRF
jgi:hypothetical protein